MYKPGATFRDKNLIKRLHAQGKSQQHMSAVTRVKPEHVAAIIKQIDAGTLRLSGSEAAKKPPPVAEKAAPAKAGQSSKPSKKAEQALAEAGATDSKD